MKMFKLFNLKKNFVEWKKYKAKIELIDDFWWRQNIRKQSLKNMGS